MNERANACKNSKQVGDLLHDISTIEHLIKERKEKLKKALVANLEMDIEIEKLEKQIKDANYHEFPYQLSEHTIDILRSFSLFQENDSKFMIALLRELYHGRTEQLQKITVSGRSATKEKSKMSKDTADLVKRIFDKRIEYAVAEEPVDEQRKSKSYLNVLMSNALRIINKTKSN